jgi:hypothetical protein
VVGDEFDEGTRGEDVATDSSDDAGDTTGQETVIGDDSLRVESLSVFARGEEEA